MLKCLWEDKQAWKFTTLLRKSVLIPVSLTLCVHLCVPMNVNKTLYLLPMKGMFARTNPQLIFLFEFLQANGTYLKGRGGVRIFWGIQCNNFEFVNFSVVFCSGSELCVGELETNYPNNQGQELMEKDNYGQHLQNIWHKQQSRNWPTMYCYITLTNSNWEFVWLVVRD